MKKGRAKIVIIITIIMIIVISLFLKKLTGINLCNLSVSNIEKILIENKETSILIYMFLNLIRPIFFVVPVWIFAVASGAIYGPLLGSLYSLIGVVISATVAFYLARFIGRDFLLSIIGEKLRGIDNKLNKNGFKVLFIMRVTVVFPFDPLSFVAGLSKMKYKPYIIATILGSIPETLAFNYLGLGLKSIISLKVLVIISIIFLIILTFFYLRKKIVC